MHFKKNDKIGTYVVVFPHKQGSYAETYRVKDAMVRLVFETHQLFQTPSSANR